MNLIRWMNLRPINPIQQVQKKWRKLGFEKVKKIQDFQDTGLYESRTESPIDNLNRSSMTEPILVSPFQGSIENSEIANLNGGSILRWKTSKLSDAYAERPPIQYLVGTIFSKPSLNIVYGAPGSFKSFVFADLACCVASGKKWLPNYGDPDCGGFPVSQGSVIWIDFDNGYRRTLDRFKAIGKALQLPGDIPLSIFSMQEPNYDARNSRQTMEIIKLIKNQDAVLVVFDNLITISGNADENSAEMAKVMSNLRRISESCDSTLIGIHHPRKGLPSQNRLGDNLRGHSSIEAALDLALFFKRTGDNSSVEIKPTKIRDSIVDTFHARFEFEIGEKNQLEKARFYSNSGSHNEHTLEVMGAIWEALNERRSNKRDLISMTKQRLDGSAVSNPGKHSIGNIIEDLHSQGYLLLEQGRNNAKIFSRNPDKPMEIFP